MSSFTLTEQRLALTQLANDATWLGSPEGVLFTAALEAEIAPHIGGIARGWGYPMEREEVVQMMLVNLLTTPAVCMSIVQAEKPFAYLAESAKKWVWAEMGHRGTRFDLVGDVVDHRTFTQDIEDADFTAWLTRTTMTHLAWCVPAALQEKVAELVAWLAASPTSRLSYEHETLKLAAEDVDLTMEQITATANICWGGRPHQAETSLFAAIIANPELTAAGYTLTQTKALALFNDRMTRSIPATLEGVAA